MNKPQLLDTDVLIDYLRGNESAVGCLEEMQGRLLISAVSVAELYAWEQVFTHTPEKDRAW